MKIKLLIILLLTSVNLWASSTLDINHEFKIGMSLLDKYSGNHLTLEKATKHFKRIYAFDQENPYALVGLSRTLYKGAFQRGKQYDQKMLNNANFYMLHALKVGAQNFDVNYYAALYYLQIVEDHGKATKYYKTALKLQPGSEKAQALNMLFTSSEELAKSLVDSENYGIANNAYSVLKRIYKNSPGTMETLHLGSIELGKKHNVNIAWDYFSYSWFLVYTKREFIKAEEVLTLSKQQMIFGVQDELEAEIKFRQGYQYLWTQKPANYQKAIALFNKCEAHNPDHKKVFYNKAMALYYLGLNTHKESYIYQAKEYMLKAKSINEKYGKIDKNLKEIEYTIQQIKAS